MRNFIKCGLLTLAFAATNFVAVDQSLAYEGAWCALYPSSQGVSENCGLSSFEMCLREIRGTGGTSFCAPNAWYRATATNDGARRHARRRHSLLYSPRGR